MKTKKTILVVLTVVLCVALFAACSGGDKADDSTGTNTDYLTWGATEWNAASDADKKAAATTVLDEVAAAAGVEESYSDADVDTLVTQVDAAMAADDSYSLQDYVDAAKQMLGQ